MLEDLDEVSDTKISMGDVNAFILSKLVEFTINQKQVMSNHLTKNISSVS